MILQKRFPKIGFRLILSILCLIHVSTLYAQDLARPSLAVGQLENELILDGLLTDLDWSNAPLLNNFLTTVPIEKGKPSYETFVRVLANEKSLIIGIDCKDANPDDIVRFSKIRDADVSNEDYLKIVLDPFLDGQSGYIFAINAHGARYDALVSNRGEDENKDWDAIWEARTSINNDGWSAEIIIPIQSISFKKGLDNWGFNVERRIQRNQETIRWANVQRDQWFIQTSRAGLLTNLPEFSYGLGLNIRPSIVNTLTKLGEDASTEYDFDASLDVSQRLGPNVLASLSLNTDFAETEVDTRQTNLTRFALFFPEKRTFFLEGSDIFEFGFGTSSRTLLPFFSRRIGLFGSTEVPMLGGVKVNGRAGKTAFGALGVHTESFTNNDISYGSTNMGVMRVRQNIFKESSIGIMSSVGDPLGRSGSWMTGVDFTYQTTRFSGNKNFIAGAWAMYTEREDITDDNSAFGIKIDYPNDKWDVAFTYMRVGEQFDPSLGFVPRKGINYWQLGGTFGPRPKWPWLRQMRNQLFISYYRAIEGPWQSYSIFTAPINWRLESGDRIEINVRPVGENILESFDIAENVEIPVGEYNFMRYRLEAELAAKRKLSGQLTWWFGSFYEGNLDEFQLQLNWNPSALLGFELNGKRNSAKLPWGDFDQTLAGLRVRFNVNSDLQLNSYLQYDTDSELIGLNARVHWIFSPLGDVFLVFNHNTINDINDRWRLQSQQILLKLRYNFRL